MFNKLITQIINICLAVDVINADMAVMAAKAVKTVMAGELWYHYRL